MTRIVEQSRVDGTAPWADGATVAEYTYYAGNQLATRAADQDGDGALETTTVYLYDADWGLLEEIEFVDEAAQSATSADLVRQHIWDPVSTNELVQARSMLRNGGGYTIPWPAWAATDRRRDVVAMHTNLFGFTVFARARHSPYGAPEPVLVGDLNHDGLLNNDDRAHLAALLAASPSGAIAMGDAAWAPDADLNFDGVIDDADLSTLTSAYVNGGGGLKEAEVGQLWGQGAGAFGRGVTIGYAGMMHDRQAGAYLMRNRWHSPTLGRFLSRDPAGYMDGMSLYAYVSGNPLKYWDPFGLACEANWHHLLPQEFKEQFEKAGVNIDDKEFGWLLDGAADHRPLHKADWNKAWSEFFEDAAKKGRELTDADIRAGLEDISRRDEFKGILARGAQPTEASYSQWQKVKDKDAAFKAAREGTADTVRKIGGKTGRVAGKAANGIARKLPVIGAVFFVADVASGENVGVAAANAVLIVDVDTVKRLGEAGQQYASDVADSRRSGFDHTLHQRYGPGMGDIIRQYRNEDR